MIGLFNSYLSTVDLVFILFNIFGACYAMYWNFKASNTGILFKPRFTVGLLAALYALSYTYLMLSNVDPSAWSSIMRGISVLTWLYVWSSPPRHGMKAQDDLGDQLERAVLLRMGIEEKKDGNEQ